MKRAALILLSLCLVAGAAACTGKSAVDQSAGTVFRYVAGTKKGTTIAESDRQKLGAVTGTLLSGGTFSLAADAGKVTVLNFWGAWCGPCRSETPQLDQLYRAVKSKGVQFVGLDVKDERENAAAFVSDYQISYPIVYDYKAETALQLGHIPMTGLPSTVVVDKQNRVAAVYIGPVTQADLGPVLTSLTAE